MTYNPHLSSSLFTTTVWYDHLLDSEAEIHAEAPGRFVATNPGLHTGQPRLSFPQHLKGKPHSDDRESAPAIGIRVDSRTHVRAIQWGIDVVWLMGSTSCRRACDGIAPFLNIVKQGCQDCDFPDVCGGRRWSTLLKRQQIRLLLRSP